MNPLLSLPLPPGLTWNYRKTPRFSTVTQRPVSGARPVSFSNSPFPSWEWELVWEVLRDQGLAEQNSSSEQKPDLFMLQDFFLEMNGANGRFIFDPAASSIQIEDTLVSEVVPGTLVNGYSGLTNGTQTVFQLYRSSGVSGTPAIVEAVDALSGISMGIGAPNPFGLYLNGSLVSSSLYTLSSFPPLQATFTEAPESGQTLSWSGNMAYVVKFSDDHIDLNQFLYQVWELQSLKLEQVPLGF